MEERIELSRRERDRLLEREGGSPGYDLFFSYPGPNHAHQTKRITGATLTKAGR